MKNLLANITAILKAPLTGELDTVHLFLLTGLILVFIAAWIMILNHIRAAATEIV
jgi:hypothetical protein